MGRKEKEGKKLGEGTMSSFFLSWGLITNWFSGFRIIQSMNGRAKNTGMLAHNPGDTRGRLQHKAEASLLPLSTLSRIGHLIDKALSQGMGKNTMGNARQVVGTLWSNKGVRNRQSTWVSDYSEQVPFGCLNFHSEMHTFILYSGINLGL